MARTGQILSVGLAFALVATLSACGTEVPIPTPTPSPTYDVTGDGVLRIGTLFPTSGNAAFLGPAQVAGVEAAIRDINAAGGINGVPVEVFHRNSGDATTETAEASLADLVAKGVDVVIGPSTSPLTERLLAPASAAGIPLITPAATYPTLTALDDDGFVSRTIASYELQGSVIASELGAKEVAYLYLKDDHGTALLESLTTALTAEGGEVVLDGSYSDTTKDFTKLVANAVKAKPDAVVLAGPASEQTTALIAALATAGLGGAKLWLTSENLADYSQTLPAGTLTKTNGVLIGAVPDEAFIAKLKQADPSVRSFQYAAEAYDATILAALSALIGSDDGGAAIARNLGVASVGGIKCTSFGECIDVLSTEPDIDFDGISGPINLTPAGDVAQGSFGIYVYSEGNIAAFVRVVVND